VATSVVKWSEVLKNSVSIIIRRYTDHMKFYWFFHILLVPLCIIVYMVVRFVYFCLILYITYSYHYVMYSYCYECSVLCILFHCVVLLIVCV
jgi:hypothetical protein